MVKLGIPNRHETRAPGTPRQATLPESGLRRSRPAAICCTLARSHSRFLAPWLTRHSAMTMGQAENLPAFAFSVRFLR